MKMKIRGMMLVALALALAFGFWGMGEARASDYETWSAALPAEQRGFDGDADGDRWRNGVEYLMGTDGMTGDGAVLPWVVSWEDEGGSTYPVVSLELPAVVPEDVALRIEVSGDLEMWEPLAERDGLGGWSSTRGSITEEAAGADRVRVAIRESAPLGEAAGRFFRLAVTHQPALDSDGDGMSDAWELLHGLDPLADDSAEDPDGDGLSNGDEFAAGTDPHAVDSDGDGAYDGWEIARGRDPLVADGMEDEGALPGAATGLLVFTPVGRL